MSSTNSLIPIIDFEKLSLHKTDDVILADDRLYVGNQIKEAFQTVGFCYLKNYGINHEIIDRYFETSRKFFSLPTEEKAKYARTTDRNFGWVSLERERLNPDRPADLKEAFNYIPTYDPHVWSSTEFQESNVAIFAYCKRLLNRIFGALSVGLELGENFLRDAHKFIGKEGSSTTLRSLYYPPIPEGSSIKPGQIRLGEHSDYGSVTMLFQDEIGGLEVEVPGVGFVPATPIPDTLVLNIGDLMQRWTSDSLKATKHRVLIPEVELKRKTHRQSVAFFVHPDDDYVVKCLDGSNKYEPITGLDYLNYRFSVTY